MVTKVPDATMTVDEAHRYIGKCNISRGGFYAAIKRGEVPHLRIGVRTLIPRSAFLQWLECQHTRPQIIGSTNGTRRVGYSAPGPGVHENAETNTKP
jgi:excisionase family DNA binding protein